VIAAISENRASASSTAARWPSPDNRTPQLITPVMEAQSSAEWGVLTALLTTDLDGDLEPLLEAIRRLP
jgi:hypothetical protein